MKTPYRRFVRRETHRSRSTAAVIVLGLLTLAALWVATEAVLAVLGFSPLVISPRGIVAETAELDSAEPVSLFGSGAILALVSVLLLTLALAPGRRPRHTIADERMAVIVDDGVIASALVRAARTAAHTQPGLTHASVSRRSVMVSLTPPSGVDVPVSHVDAAVDEELDRIQPLPRPLVRIRVADSGRV